MAIRTGDLVVSRQASVEKELFAQLDFSGMTYSIGGNGKWADNGPMSATDISSSTMVLDERPNS
jgi:hypothetical protein